MKITRNYVSLKIENPLFIEGILYIDDTEVGIIRGLSCISLEDIEEGIYTLTLSTPRGNIKNILRAAEGEVHTIHLAHEFQEREIDLRFSEGIILMREHGDIQRLRELVSIPGLMMRQEEKTKKTLLHMAVDHSFYEGAKLLLEGGVPVDPLDLYASTPLMSAVEKSNVDLVKLLLKHGAHTDLRDCHNETPLMKGISFHRNALNIAEILLARGARTNISSRTSGYTPLQLATLRGLGDDFIDLLIAEDSSVHMRDPSGSTLVDLALAGGNIPVIKKLLAMDIPACDPASMFRALNTGDLFIATEVFSFFKDANMKNIHGITLLMTACSRGFLEGVELLLDMGADTEIRDREGETALFYSCHAPEVCRLLLDRGASRDAVNSRGETLLLKLIPEKTRDTALLLINL